MRLDDSSESQNVEDRRGMRGIPGGGRSIGLGTIILALVAMYFGVDPSFLLDGASNGTSVAPSGPSTEMARPAQDEQARFVSKVLGETERTWSQIFQQAGRRYINPKLVMYTGATQTACGVGQSAMGPFYCPLDQKVYIDLSFYDDMQRRFHAPGDFAQAYVIAHEVGHHVQNLLGIADQVQRARERASERQSNQLSVRMELQADCFAGVWARSADNARKILDAGDIEEALNAASAIGDDRLQKRAQGYAVPDSFTHGSSTQRVRWFRQGFESGSVERCDTFSAANL